ncbi:hypothetical protein [Pedobacter sp. SYSU D00535]|uniref:hypothetical protein n=1 Tax=Pedobacter sp. SYSU D00535 TaxID=2810308 RepID=UPI001F6063A6|nr:hypothetical protein [Pedobacter sp. SYSU D00535]
MEVIDQKVPSREIEKPVEINGTKVRSPWIQSPLFDSAFILLPPFLALILVAFFPQQFKTSDEMPFIYWLLLIVFVDVAHVYSTLYRTYFNPSAFNERRSLLVSVPVFCYIIGVILYSISPLLFWRSLAYLAVFHFIRQQYGIMRLYARFEKKSKLSATIDTISIYTCTLYPILFWHLNPDRNFNWFVEGDFLFFESRMLREVAAALYLVILALYAIKELAGRGSEKPFNLPKNLVIAGTTLSWYFGIVHFNGDMAFTTLNVLSHGIPYMALIWTFEKDKFRRSEHKKGKIQELTFGKFGLPAFVSILFLLAYLEEALWDGLVWREHAALFGLFNRLPQVANLELLSLLVPLLALPQFTHYVLDGFIWRMKEKVS